MPKVRIKNSNSRSGVLKGPVFFFVLCCLFFNAATASAFEARVRYVIDGDTFVLADNRHVRIAGIDTPEIGRDGKPDQYYARQAKAMLNKLILGKRVRIEPAGKGKDRYKRIIGWVYVDNLFVNKRMIRKGAAFYYFHKGNDRGKQKLLLQAQRNAYKEKKGFWPVVSKLKKFNKPWVGNKKSRRCFLTGDRYAEKIGRLNRVKFSSLGEAFYEGYSPARHLNFWPIVK
ncbi:thermonuclease family protein [Desulfovibrio sp. JC010]|uniref:thermonuclease family protein n=1 Tax=Desulfovibrio sp. JC010 TaxID=2593641 RepID=UPI0013D1194C|nr:thermonuclease family protein [Desulfovibrio sp. JC010]NDV27356.1 nuclease [Desulfovibrio sp. JC010]